ncbi:hypothetical protein H6P81_004404 [Aristolochia fimbriata]|uniref:Uncharacterized protein n=1 Tax=Aristolochia fimbriata TaxID=158543 RepID=A0AAV7FHM4_ARIFI|nr:hypothetical protein H6P81_004404 [Aristolochia fimbriata]
MALEIHWYDVVCFAIIAGAVLASVWVLFRREGAGKGREGSKYSTRSMLPLLGGETSPEDPGDVAAAGRRLWTSCWRWMDPVWLLGLRAVSAAVMALLLACDIARYDATIFVYYTDWKALNNLLCDTLLFDLCFFGEERGNLIIEGNSYSGVKMAADDEIGLQYWLRWQVPLCALIFIVPAIVAVAFVLRERRVPMSSDGLWMPCWKRLHPFWLLGYRLLVFFLMSYILVRMVAVRGIFEFYFYTQWTFALVIVYFALGAAISAHGCWKLSKHHIHKEEEGPFLSSDLDENTPSLPFTINNVNDSKLPSQGQQHEKQRVAGFWGYLMQILYQTCAGAVVLTDVVFWCIIVPFLTNEHFKLNMLMGCMHSLNFVFLLLDTACNSLPFPLFRLAYFVLWSCLYVIFQWVLHACGFTWWPYPFLELATPWAPAWYLCLALIHIPCYGFYLIIVKAKHSLFPQLFPNAYIRSA